MKILITGFEAFMGETINPSELLLKSVAATQNVDTLLLPVSFNKAFPLLKEKIQSANYNTIIMLGQAGQRSKISLEKIAINWRETESPDNEGITASPGHPILPDAENAYFSTLPLNKMKEALIALQIPVEISYTAGTYVCNDLFYKTAQFLNGSEQKCGFIHVPYLPEQALQRPGVPSMELSMMEKALKAIIQAFA